METQIEWLFIGTPLDTERYPIGIAVTREQLRRLPIQAHHDRGAWNYTILPATGNDGDAPLALRAEDRARSREQALAILADQRLTGMSTAELASLAALLAPAQAAQAAQRCYEQRGGQRRRAPGAGSRGLLSDADRVLVTVVYLRQICSQNVLSDLLGINANSIGSAIAETRQLLTEHHRPIDPTTLRFTTAAALAEFVASSDDTQRPRLPDLLADPALTGMPRTELTALTERVGHIQNARNERHRHRRRGGERLPGARGGVFRQKITNTERVLATVLYQRKLCSQDTLADLFHVSRRTISDVVREIAPILAQDAYTPAPATHRFATAAALLDSIAHPDAAATPPT